MNTDRITRLADFMETLPDSSFDMTKWWYSHPGYSAEEAREFSLADIHNPIFDNENAPEQDAIKRWERLYILDARDIIKYRNFCGTEACVAGWAAALFDDPRNTAADIIPDTAALLLELTNQQQDEMFLPDGADDDHRFSRKAAVAMLRKAATTQVVDWDAINDGW